MGAAFLIERAAGTSQAAGYQRSIRIDMQQHR